MQASVSCSVVEEEWAATESTIIVVVIYVNVLLRLHSTICLILPGFLLSVLSLLT